MKTERNFDILPLEYYMTFESGEMSEVFEWEESLTDDEKSAYIETLMLAMPLDESPVLVGVMKRAAKEIIEGGLDEFICSDSAYKLNIRFAGA